MEISKRNTEGYMDLTAYHALVNISKQENPERKKKCLVFICSPYAGDIQGNTMRAKRYGRFAVSKNTIPVIPILMYPQFLEDDDPDDRKLGLEMGLVLLERCREVWVFGERISNGMREEIDKAKKLQKVIKYFTIDCREKEGR